VIDVALAIKSYFNSDSTITIGGEFRIGDIRHNIADISLISGLLGYAPNTTFVDGLNKFLNWAEHEPVSDKSAYTRSVEELSKRGLMG
jgi:dTDP-L-rhamnose 4-epimerase